MIQLTPEQIEINKRFCAKRLIKKSKRVIKKGKSKKPFKEIMPNLKKVEKIVDYIIQNSPVSSCNIAKEFNSEYIYHRTLRKHLVATKKVSYSKKKKVWYVRGKKIPDYPGDTQKSRLLSEIQKKRKITTVQAKKIGKASTRTYLSLFKKAGLIENPAYGMWQWVDK